MGFERKREDGGKGRAERGTGLETGRSRGRNFLNYKSDLEKQCVGLVGLGGDVQWENRNRAERSVLDAQVLLVDLWLSWLTLSRCLHSELCLGNTLVLNPHSLSLLHKATGFCGHPGKISALRVYAISISDWFAHILSHLIPKQPWKIGRAGITDSFDRRGRWGPQGLSVLSKVPVIPLPKSKPGRQCPSTRTCRFSWAQEWTRAQKTRSCIVSLTKYPLF